MSTGWQTHEVNIDGVTYTFEWHTVWKQARSQHFPGIFTATDVEAARKRVQQVIQEI